MDVVQCREVDISLAGLAIMVAAPSVPPAASLLLAPQDWDVHVATNGAAGTVAVLLGVRSVTACLSVAAASALSGLAAALTPSSRGSGGEAEAPGSSLTAGDQPARGQQRQAGGEYVDDLACGLFSLSPELAGRPGMSLAAAQLPVESVSIRLLPLLHHAQCPGRAQLPGNQGTHARRPSASLAYASRVPQSSRCNAAAFVRRRPHADQPGR